MMTPGAFIADELTRWEGGLSLDPNDAGNWSTGVKGQGVFLGSNHGLTGRTLATFRGCPVAAITPADIAAITLDDAVQVSLKLFYYGPGLNRLPWGRVPASLLDFLWGTGPKPGMQTMQDLLNISKDGILGSGTVNAYNAKLAQWGEPFLAGAWLAMREEWYEDLVASRPSDGVYLNGWINRTDYFSPGNPQGFWSRFGA